MQGAMTFSNFVIILLHLCKFFTLIYLIILSISLVDILLHFMLGKGLLDILNK
jgi:hypothetical protein